MHHPALMLSVFIAAIELTCLIESISTNNPRIEWKKIKNGVPSYVYFQNKISGKLLGHSFLKAHQPVRPQHFKIMSQDLKLSRMNGTLKEVGIDFCFSELWGHAVYVNEQLLSVFFSLSLSQKGTWSTELSSESQPTSWSSTPLGQILQSTAARWPPSMIKGTLMRYLLVLQWEVWSAADWLRNNIVDHYMIALALDQIYIYILIYQTLNYCALQRSKTWQMRKFALLEGVVCGTFSCAGTLTSSSQY